MNTFITSYLKDKTLDKAKILGEYQYALFNYNKNPECLVDFCESFIEPILDKIEDLEREVKWRDEELYSEWGRDSNVGEDLEKANNRIEHLENIIDKIRSLACLT